MGDKRIYNILTIRLNFPTEIASVLLLQIPRIADSFSNKYEKKKAINFNQ